LRESLFGLVGEVDLAKPLSTAGKKWQWGFAITQGILSERRPSGCGWHAALGGHRASERPDDHDGHIVVLRCRPGELLHSLEYPLLDLLRRKGTDASLLQESCQ
jgi:hypothetical protein